MKKLLLVTKSAYARKLYLDELTKVFSDHLAIISVSDADDTGSYNSLMADADLVLLTNIYSFPKARRLMKENASIINLKYTFSKAKVEQLRGLPVGTSVLASFNYYSSAQEAVNKLYECNLSNLDLYLNYPDNPNLTNKHIDLAVYSQDPSSIPDDIVNRFDLGPRCLSLETLWEIASKANILDDNLIAKIHQYCADKENPEETVTRFYDLSASSNVQLKALMNCIDSGIVIYDTDYNILNYNNNFHKMYRLNSNLYKQNLIDLLGDTELREIICEKTDVINRLCEVEKYGFNLTVTKRELMSGYNSSRVYMLRMKRLWELTEQDNAIRKQIANRGLTTRYSFENILGESEAIKQAIEKANKLAKIDKPTLIIGESGVGKELFVQSIHNASSRNKYPFVAMNCAAIPESLLESELFGYVDGAFTGARKGGKDGLFQLAQRGTLFLDEIGEMSLSTQAKLLRVLEEREVMKIGGDSLIGIDVRVIAATNRNLKQLVEEGKFRMDLFYRLNTLMITIPPLRSRKEDIMIMIDQFVNLFGYEKKPLSHDVESFFMKYDWPGNIRELRNCVEYIYSVSGSVIRKSDLPEYLLEEYDKEEILSVPASLESESQSKPEPGESLLHEEETAVLRIISQGHSGRAVIREKLLDQDVNLSEYRIRNILSSLAEAGLITVPRGRSGCCITPRGMSILK